MSKFILIFLLSANPSFAYETGAMTCEQLGQFAAATVHGKNAGHTYAKAISIINRNVPGSSFIERRNLTDITYAIYKQPWGKHLSEDGAYSSFKIECEGQQ